MDLSVNKHWEHGYASTVHASQGSTKYRTFFHINAPQGNESGKIKNSDLAKMAKVFLGGVVFMWERLVPVTSWLFTRTIKIQRLRLWGLNRIS